MKIEELSFYLPFGLLVECPYDSFENIQLLTGLTKSEFETTYIDVLNIDTFKSPVGNYFAWDGENNYAKFEVKPLLLPKSYLLDEITVNGKTNHRIYFMVEGNSNCCDAHREWLETFIDNPTHGTMLFHAPFFVFRELLSEKIDIFGLIDSGEAIDVTKLEHNPYEYQKQV